MERLTAGRRPPAFRASAAATLALALSAMTAPVAGDPAAPPAVPVPAEAREVRVERVRPRRPKLETLRFLKANRDFIRARFDGLRLRTLDRPGVAGEIDPRFLRYPDMLAEVLADRDTLRTREDAWRRRELMARIAELGALEDRLDALERVLADQRFRLGMLQEDFTGDQRTALIVVVSGEPAAAALSEIAIELEDGSRLSVPIHPAEREALRRGGVVQVFHGFVEPREQVVEVAIAGDRWPAGDRGFVTLEPERNRLMMLRLDLSGVDAARGTAGIRASTWLHETKLPTGG